MKNLHNIELRLNAENHIVERKDLCVDHKLQMRTQMNQRTIEEYADNIAMILEINPIDVIAVMTAEGEERWYIVDGFHRYHAAVFADVINVNIRLMRGTYADALQYAMTANWENGMRPSSDDAKRSIPMLLETAPDFGFDSKAVNKWVTSFGIPASTARNYTSTIVDAVKAKRDAEIVRLDAEGNTLREIAHVVGGSPQTIKNILDTVQKCPEDKTGQEDDHDAAPFDIDEPMFDEEDLDTAQAINPADAFQKALDEHEAERQETTRQQDKSVSSTSMKSKLEETLDELVLLWETQGEDALLKVLRECEVKQNIFKRLAGLV